MEMIDSVEAKQLIKVNEKFLTVAKTVYAFRNNVKALKTCLKLVKLEIKQMKKTKQPVDGEQLNRLMRKYGDLQASLKNLIKTKDVHDTNKYCEEIEEMIKNTEQQIAELKGMSAMSSIAATAQKIGNAVSETAQKIGSAVSEKLDGLKKKIAPPTDSE